MIDGNHFTCIKSPLVETWADHFVEQEDIIVKVLVVVCNFDAQSFNHAIANVIKEEYLKKGYDVLYHDLYEDNFNPVFIERRV